MLGEITKGELEDMLHEQERIVSNLADVIRDMATDYDAVMTELTKLFEFLDYQEESDSGRLFNPIFISCSRAMKVKPLGECVDELKRLTVKYNNCEGAE